MKKIIGLITVFTFFSVFAEVPADKPITLSLTDAIYLAIRYNTSLYSAELDRIVQKYAVVVAKNNFEPQYNFQSSWNYDELKSSGVKTYSSSFSASPTGTLNNHYGTKFSLAMAPPYTLSGEHFNPSITFSVVQPLLKSFGKAVVDAALNDALDTERLNKIAFKNKAETTITTIINDYLTIVSDQQNLQIDQLALESDKTTLKNTEELVAAGRRAGSDLIQPKTDLAQQESVIRKDIETIRNDKAVLLDDLGLSRAAKIEIPNMSPSDFDAIAKQLKEDKLPSLNLGGEMALKQSPDYQGAKNALISARRQLVVAKNGRLWDLSLTAKEMRGGGESSVGSNGSGLNSLVNSQNYDQSIEADLTIPIDDVGTKQTLIQAQVSLQEAKVALDQGERSLLRNILTQYDSLNDLKKQVEFSEKSLELQQENVRLAKLQYNLGRISALDYSTQRKNLSTQAQTVVSNRIAYINALAQLTQALGTTLDCFGIKIRY